MDKIITTAKAFDSFSDLFLTATLITQKPKKFIQGLEREIGDSLDCPDCYPLCSLSRYLVQATYSELTAEEITGGSWGIM